MCDSITPNRKPKWNTPRYTITIEDAGDRLGLRVIMLEGLEAPVRNFLKDTECLRGVEDTLLKTKKRVYKRIQGLVAEGYPSEVGLDFKEANVNDLVYVTIVLIVADFSTRTHNTLVLHRRSQPAATGFSAGGYEEFVIVDWVSPVFPKVQSVRLRGRTERTMGRGPSFFG